MPLRNLLFSLIILCFACIAFFVYYTEVDKELRATGHAYAGEVLKQSSQSVRRSVTGLFNTLESTALALEYLNSGRLEESLPFLDTIAQKNGFKRMGLVSLQGQATTTDGAKLFLGDREYVKKSFAGKTSLSGMLQERIGTDSGGGSINVYAAPVWQNGSVIATIFATYDTEYLASTLATSLFNGRGFLYLLRVDGTLVAAQHQAAFAHFPNIIQGLRHTPNAEALASLREDMRQGARGSVHMQLEGETYQVSYEPVGTDGLYVMATVPHKVLTERTALHMGMTAILLLVLLVLMLAQIWHLWRVNRQMARETGRAREEAAASRAKSVFLSTMSHEIRTPLNAVVGFLHILGKSELSLKQRGYVRKISVATDALLKIIDDILDFSRIEAGGMILKEAPFSLCSLLDAVSSILGEAARSKGLTLHIEADAHIPPLLMGDAPRLTQVLLNLANNAIKFTSEGHIRICVQCAPPSDDAAGKVWLAFSVQDTGIGISAQQLARLFQPFSQADMSTTRIFGGAGLGLVISRKLIQLMGGEIHVLSRPGEGSDFRFTIGFVPGQDLTHTADMSQDAQNSLAAPWEGKQILVVEDNEINQEIISEVLRGFGLAVDLASNGSEAVQRLAEHRYDLVLMDMQMPVMDGLEATRKLRAMEQDHAAPCAATPVVALTANVTQEDRQRCMDAGMNDYLTKPIDVERMRQCLEQWLG